MEYVLVLTCICIWLCQVSGNVVHTVTDSPMTGERTYKVEPHQPGLSFRPRPNIVTTLIRIHRSNSTSYTPYVDNIEMLLGPYENMYQQDWQTMDCSWIDGIRPQEEWDRACRFEFFDLGSKCVRQEGFGYSDGQPCILLELDKIFDWMPEPYTNETRPSEIADTWTQYAITVHCEGETAADKDNLGDVYYFPSNGFHFKYFPYRSQPGYMSPLVFVRFDNVVSAQLLMVTCKVYAKNINHDSMTQAGRVHFELLVE